MLQRLVANVNDLPANDRVIAAAGNLLTILWTSLPGHHPVKTLVSKWQIAVDSAMSRDNGVDCSLNGTICLFFTKTMEPKAVSAHFKNTVNFADNFGNALK
jgi:hypothetical protein